MKVCDDEDVELMFDVYAQWSQLGTIELYITFESGPTSQHNTINPSQPSTSNMPNPNYFPSQHYEPYSSQQISPYQPDEELGDYSENDETYFDESSGDSDDDDIDEDMEAEDQLIPPVFDPPFHMKNINLSTANQPTEFDHMFIDEVPNLDGTLEVGMKFQNKDECVYAIKRYHLKQSLNFVVQKSDLESYRKAWLGKNKAIEQIYGNWEKSYNLLPRWLLVMQTFAPRTIIKMETIPAYNEHGLINGMTIFHRLFWAYVPCISAFKFCKPIVQVDGTWLYGKYKGTLLVAVAQDGNDNIIPIAYALVEGETKEAWSFFLRNLRSHVTPQANICLISDRHESIKSAYNNLNNGWQHPPSKHVFCVRHIAQNFAREFKDNALKNKVISMGYSINESTYRYYRREIGIVNPEALKWLDNIPRQDWIQAFDGGSRWGQMTTNIVESMNAVLKEPRNLPITALVQSTYYKTGTLFPTMAKQHASILASGQIYTEKCMTFMKSEIRKSNSHRVDCFDRSNHTFMVHETVVPKEGRPIGHFSINLPNKWCDCGKYQAKHMPCSHVIAACSSIKYDYWSLISEVYKVETVLKVYSEAINSPSEMVQH
ncbi:uncharacterized protein [Cicer arietinum]|uniref:uncharacterized protein n=1 Tax=Cicer arietinum TaxID=3827 RepID=UPI003CC53FDE